MAASRVVVIGADAAGMSAANQAIRTAQSTGRELEVIALERTRYTSYSACGIPYWIAGDVASGADLVARTAEQHRAVGIDLRQGVTVVRLDPAGRSVACRSATGVESILEYDDLVIATGAKPILPAWAHGADGAPYRGLGAVKDLDDGAAWLDRMAERRGRLLIAGGGYLGVEMAEAGLRKGYRVTLLTRSVPMSSLDPDMSQRIVEGLRTAGVQVVERATAVGADTGADGWVRAVTTADGRRFEGDLLVLALGITPALDFAQGAGLPVGTHGGLLAGPTGLVAPGIWAAGDCCEVRHRLTGLWTYLPLGTHANKAGRAVGTNLGGGQAEFGGALGTAITRFSLETTNLEIARTGLSTAEADRAGIEVRSLVTEGTTASGYMPEAEPIAAKVFAEPRNRRLLGAQIIGGSGAGKRIDAFAAAIWAGMSIDDFAWADLSYAPPFATAWEFSQIAARRLAERL